MSEELEELDEASDASDAEVEAPGEAASDRAGGEAFDEAASLALGSGPVVAPRRPRVLVVEDCEDLRESLCEWLDDAGYDVVEAAHGQAALEHLLGGPAPALILLDLHMPVMSGWDLLSVLRSYSRLASIPVVVISGSGYLVSRLRRHTTVLRKPFDARRLLRVVGELAPRDAD